MSEGVLYLKVNEESSGKPLLVTGELIRKVVEKVCDNREFSDEFPQIVLYEVVTERLGYR